MHPAMIQKPTSLVRTDLTCAFHNFIRTVSWSHILILISPVPSVDPSPQAFVPQSDFPVQPTIPTSSSSTNPFDTPLTCPLPSISAPFPNPPSTLETKFESTNLLNLIFPNPLVT